jgi:hypothetical protein
MSTCASRRCASVESSGGAIAADPPEQDIPRGVERARPHPMAARTLHKATRAAHAASSRGGDLLGPGDLWYKDAVIYALNVESFQDSDGDGMGDFAGLTSRIDYLPTTTAGSRRRAPTRARSTATTTCGPASRRATPTRG